VTAVVAYTSFPYIVLYIRGVPADAIPHVAFFLLKNIVSDYCSLFFVRRWLLLGANRPLLALITGPLVGALVVVVVFLLIDVTRYTVFDVGWFEWVYFLEGIGEYIDSLQTGSMNSKLRMGAFIIHLWLPLFAVGVVIAQGLNSVRFATTWSLWFLKNGSRQPFRAIGLVAALVVFFGAAAMQVLLGWFSR
jgi:hypothetical protein